MSHVPKRWLPSRLFVWESQEVTKSQRNNFFICSRVPYQSSQTPLSVGLWYTQDWPFIFQNKKPCSATFCPTPRGDVMAQTSSRSSWARCGETSSTGSLNQGQWRAWWWKNSPTSQCSPGKNADVGDASNQVLEFRTFWSTIWFTFNGWIRLVSSGMIETFHSCEGWRCSTPVDPVDKMTGQSDPKWSAMLTFLALNTSGALNYVWNMNTWTNTIMWWCVDYIISLWKFCCGR